MRIVYFTHSLVSCWNHGNAHFLRGVLRALIARGHEVVSYDPNDGWSRSNLVVDHGHGVTEEFERAFPDLAGCVRFLGSDIDAILDGTDLAIVHGWNEPSLVKAIGRERAKGGGFALLFYDTHHRAVSDPEAIARFDLSGYDGVMAFGETLAAAYRRRGMRVFVWHEAADTRLFRPPEGDSERAGAVWIGNWGDDERSAELRHYLLRPTAAVGIPLDVHGVRYPDTELACALTTAPHSGAVRIFWDVDAPATIAEMRDDTAHPLRRRLPNIDLVLTYGGGPPVVDAYRSLGARDCVPIYNALDPAAHFPVAPDPALAANLGFLANRMPDREARSEAFFFQPATSLSHKAFSAWRFRMGRQADTLQHPPDRSCRHRPAQRIQLLLPGGAERGARQHGEHGIQPCDARVRGSRRRRMPDH